jgi:hypothetical protein
VSREGEVSFSWMALGATPGDLHADARERCRSGSRWSARSDARTNDLEAGQLAPQNYSGCQWRRVAWFDHQGVSLRSEKVVKSRLGC